MRNRLSWKVGSLRAFVTCVIVGIVVIALTLSGFVFYIKSASVLQASYAQKILTQFEQTNILVEDRTALIDNMFALLMSNNTIRENLEPTSSTYRSSTPKERQLAVERQVTSLIISNYLWNQKFINSIFISTESGQQYAISLKSPTVRSTLLSDAFSELTAEPSLQIFVMEDVPESIYFARNIYSSYTGEKIASIIIDISQEVWRKSYSENIDEHWLVYLFDQNMQLLNAPDDTVYEADIRELLGDVSERIYIQEVKIQGENYEFVSEKLSASGIISVIAAPTDYLYHELQTTLTGFLLMFVVLILLTILVTIVVSRLVTAPIENMITQVKSISSADRAQVIPAGMYSEFNDFAEAFNNLLHQLEIYYSELYEKRMLLQNAEIKALQAQMNPHFLFNVLDTLAWKASMCEDEDIYQMVISLAELMRMTILSHNTEFVTLEQELKYIEFYLFLQRTRFEGRFLTEILVDEDLMQCKVPCFSVQPLVENAVVHGLEPKKGIGHLKLEATQEDETLRICVEDDGVGFQVPPKIDEIKPSSSDSKTHIGLRNLDRRLKLLYGENCHIQIQSDPNINTAISFSIPIEEV